VSRWVYNEEEYESGSKWFARWHREQPEDDAKAIDIDLVGYCPATDCLDPLYLVEATRATKRKTASVLERMGQLLEVPVFVVYQDRNGAHPGEILVDERSANRNLGWLPAADVWQIFLRIRHAHACRAQGAA